MTVFARSAAVVCLCAAIVAVSACKAPTPTPPPAPTPAPTQEPPPAPTPTALPLSTYRVAAPGDVLTLDPARASGFIDRWICGELLFETLYAADPSGKLAPRLAEALPVVSPDGRIVTITLRSGAAFHDGAPVTAADVKFSLERTLNPATGSWGAAGLLLIDGAAAVADGSAAEAAGIRVVDPRTLAVSLTQPHASLPALLSQSVYAVVPKKSVVEAGVGWGDSVAVGSGPYTFGAWEKGVRVELARAAGSGAGVEAVEIALNVVPVVGVERIGIGHADFVPLVVSDELLRERSKLAGAAREAPAALLMQIAFNPNNKAMGDLRLRQAIASAINKDALVKRLSYGALAHDLLPPALPEYDAAAAAPLAFDRERARQLLLDAGYPNGILRMLILTDEPRDQIEVLQTDLRAIGIETEAINSGAADVVEKLRSGEVALTLRTAQPAYLDGAAVLDDARAACVIAKQCAAEIDALIDQIERAPFGSPERAALIRQAAKRTQAEELWVLPLVWKQSAGIGRAVRENDPLHPVYLLPDLTSVRTK